VNALKTNHERVGYFQSNADKATKLLEAQIAELTAKLEQALREIQELSNQKSKSLAENVDVGRKLEEAESELNQLGKAKQAMAKSLEEAKSALEEENRIRTKLQGESRNLQGDLDHIREQLEEEQGARSDAQRLITKANTEAATWRKKLESGEGGVSSEALDELKRKLSVKLQETEAQLEAAVLKANSLDKANHRLRGELEDLGLEVERVSITICNLLFNWFLLITQCKFHAKT